VLTATKECKTCLIPKLFTLFSKDISKKDGHRGACKECEKPKKAAEYRKNKAKYVEYRKINLSARNEHSKAWGIENRKKVNRYEKTRLLVDQQFKWQRTIRWRTKALLKYGLKKGKIVQSIGCTSKHFRIYLEANFQPGMNWGNYGKKHGQWCLDHTFPLSKADLTNDLSRDLTSHYSNVRPVWVEQNIKKASRIL